MDWIISKSGGSRFVKTDEFRIRKVLSLFGFIIIDGLTNDFIGTGKWFTLVEIKEEKYYCQYEHFDDGWSYQNYWGSTKTEWKFIELLH